jgi:hypothetical protein
LGDILELCMTVARKGCLPLGAKNDVDDLVAAFQILSSSECESVQSVLDTVTAQQAALSRIDDKAKMKSNYDGVLRGMLSQQQQHWKTVRDHVSTVCDACMREHRSSLESVVRSWNLLKSSFESGEMDNEMISSFRTNFSETIKANRDSGKLGKIASSLSVLVQGMADSLQTYRGDFATILIKCMTGQQQLSETAANIRAFMTHVTALGGVPKLSILDQDLAEILANGFNLKTALQTIESLVVSLNAGSQLLQSLAKITDIVSEGGGTSKFIAAFSEAQQAREV